MLETQRSSENQRGDGGNFADVPFTLNLSAIVSALLPESSDVSCSCSRVASHQISGSNGPCDVGALGKVLSLVAGGEDAAVTARSGGSPRGYLAAFGGYGQCPAGVDELDCAPADLVLSKDVYDSYSVISNLNSGKPKEQQGSSHNQGNSWQGNDRNCHPLSHKNYHPGKHHYDCACYGDGPAGSGSEYLHAMSLACRWEVLS